MRYVYANSPKERMSKLTLNAKVDTEPDLDEYDAQLNAMIALEESMKEEDETQPAFIDGDGYEARIYIGGMMLNDANAMCRKISPTLTLILTLASDVERESYEADGR